MKDSFKDNFVIGNQVKFISYTNIQGSHISYGIIRAKIFGRYEIEILDAKKTIVYRSPREIIL